MTPYRCMVKRPDDRYQVLMAAISKDKLGYNHLIIKSVELDLIGIYEDKVDAGNALLQTVGKTISKNNSTILGYYDIHFNEYTKEYEIKHELVARARILSILLRMAMEIYCMRNGLEIMGGL